MFRGELVEQGDAEAVISAPQHPYTRRLVEASITLEDFVDRDFTPTLEASAA
jgi:peptide/nickel transport system ATP-binding protein